MINKNSINDLLYSSEVFSDITTSEKFDSLIRPSVKSLRVDRYVSLKNELSGILFLEVDDIIASVKTIQVGFRFVLSVNNSTYFKQEEYILYFDVIVSDDFVFILSNVRVLKGVTIDCFKICLFFMKDNHVSIINIQQAFNKFEKSTGISNSNSCDFNKIGPKSYDFNKVENDRLKYEFSDSIARIFDFRDIYLNLTPMHDDWLCEIVLKDKIGCSIIFPCVYVLVMVL